jgi:hypothetical protein
MQPWLKDDPRSNFMGYSVVLSPDSTTLYLALEYTGGSPNATLMAFDLVQLWERRDLTAMKWIWEPSTIIELDNDQYDVLYAEGSIYQPSQIRMGPWPDPQSDELLFFVFFCLER